MESATGRWSELLTGRQIAPLIAVCLGVWLHAADGLMVATLMPDIVADIGGANVMAWTLALYEIGSITASAACAVLALSFGLRTAMTGAALVYLAGCATSALAPSMNVMLAGRLAQGFGGGGLVALSFVAISQLFDRALMPKAMAAISALWGISSFIGPLVGGLFAEWEIWRGAFWFFAAQAALLAAWIAWGGALKGARDGAGKSGPVPLVRLAVLGAGVVLIAAAGIRVSAMWTPLLLAAGLALVAVFFVLDAWAEASRMLPARAADPRSGIGAGLWAVFAFAVATVAMSIYGPLTMIALHGISALTAGYILALSSIGWSVTAVAVSGMPERHDGALILAGLGLVALGVALYAIAVPEGPLWLIAFAACIEGGGFGVAWTFILRRATSLSPLEDEERVASALPTIQRLGYAMGAALIGIVANTAGIAERMSVAEAHNAALWIFAACVPPALLGLVAALRFVRAPPIAPARATQAAA